MEDEALERRLALGSLIALALLWLLLPLLAPADALEAADHRTVTGLPSAEPQGLGPSLLATPSH